MPRPGSREAMTSQLHLATQPPCFSKSLRPFSLVVALVSCGLGVALALLAEQGSGLRALVIVLTGLVLQAGVNLINDQGDLPLLQEDAYRHKRERIRRHSQWGLLCIGLSTLVGGVLVLDVGWTLLGIMLLGLLGALGYTTEPIHYKRRGLGVPLVFWLMGVLMIVGAYHAMDAPVVWAIVWRSFPVSLLVALLLLSNELRDWEADSCQGVQTLAVRLGFARGCKLYLLMLAATYLLTLLLWQQGLVLRLWPLLPSLLLLPELIRLLGVPAEQRHPLTPKTGRLLLVFGVLFGGCLVPL
ncbi:MAG: 1,4-dihydroxy-2-naphthoate octaprenyltransferase [Motiliproteus sp.]|jgi:1,4-dihydroxy-2-naphthoate octaprenyltransferase